MVGTRKRISLQGPRGQPIVQTSPFFKLPAEIRNEIYEYAVQEVQSISIRYDRVLHSSTFSLVCRQIREEYREIYIQDAANYAKKLSFHITDFIHRSRAHGDVAAYLNSLPQLPPEQERSYTLRIFLTNFWDSQRLALREVINGKPLNTEPEERANGTTRPYDVEISWDPKTFDVEFCRQALTKLKFHFGDVEEASSAWLKVLNALEEAFVRYDPEPPTVKRKRKRKRNGEARTGVEKESSVPVRKFRRVGKKKDS